LDTYPKLKKSMSELLMLLFTVLLTAALPFGHLPTRNSYKSLVGSPGFEPR